MVVVLVVGGEMSDGCTKTLLNDLRKRTCPARFRLVRLVRLWIRSEIGTLVIILVVEVVKVNDVRLVNGIVETNQLVPFIIKLVMLVVI